MAIKVEIELDCEKLHEQLRQVVREIVEEILIGDGRAEETQRNVTGSPYNGCPMISAGSVRLAGIVSPGLRGFAPDPDFGIGEGLPGIADNLTQKIARDIAALIHGSSPQKNH